MSRDDITYNIPCGIPCSIRFKADYANLCAHPLSNPTGVNFMNVTTISGHLGSLHVLGLGSFVVTSIFCVGYSQVTD